jgi:hypothetical protein
VLVAHLEEGEEEEEEEEEGGLCCQVSLKYCKGIFLDARSFSWVFVKGKSFAAFSSALSFFLSAWDSGTERERESCTRKKLQIFEEESWGGNNDNKKVLLLRSSVTRS